MQTRLVACFNMLQPIPKYTAVDFIEEAENTKINEDKISS
jgi:hypothetical protein